jgi:hypothetical protein
MSICLRQDLRLQLEQIRLQRGRQLHKLPSLRSLIEEALEALVVKETARP